MWLRDYHFDGLRLDALHAIVDNSPEPFIEQLAEEVKKVEAQLGRHLVLIAEDDLNDPRLLWSQGRGGFALHAQWNDDFHHALHAVLTGETTGYYSDFGKLADLCKALQKAYVYDGCYSAFRKRRQGRVPEGLDGSRFLAYLQNHDQIGNRATRGTQQPIDEHRPVESGGGAHSDLAVSCPCFFKGKSGEPPPLFFIFPITAIPLWRQRYVREAERVPGFTIKPEDIPDPQAPDTFARSKLVWDELSEPRHAELLDWHKRLIRLRRSNPCLCDGRMEDVSVRFDEDERWLILERGPWSVACNLGPSPVTVQLREGVHELVVASEIGVGVTLPTVTLPPDSVAILKF
jgi:maltooligosyltrehalose trehalohydrolase